MQQRNVYTRGGEGREREERIGGYWENKEARLFSGFEKERKVGQLGTEKTLRAHSRKRFLSPNINSVAIL